MQWHAASLSCSAKSQFAHFFYLHHRGLDKVLYKLRNVGHYILQGNLLQAQDRVNRVGHLLSKAPAPIPQS
jgi:hypothetical protein